jgi:hypothetical protein
MKRPWWTYSRRDVRHHLNRGGLYWRLFAAHWWIKSHLTGACHECGLPDGNHKMNCDHWQPNT